MACRLSRLCLATLTILPAVAAAATTNITSEILDFVPVCAQACFQSFISANFDAAICGNSPSLDCLCRQRGSSGYTIGEGALSCLVGETRFGACEGQDVANDATGTAYNMCVGIARAAPETHSTIVATLVVPQSGTGPLLVPTALPTTSSRGMATVTISTTPTPTVSLPTGTETSPTTASTGLAAPASTPTASPDTSAGQTQLSSAQIVGITLGCIAVVVFGILLVLIARCVRRSRFGDLERGFSRLRDSMSFGRKSRPLSAPGVQISSPLIGAPVRNPADARRQPNMQQGGVGLAIPPLPARGGVLARPSPALASLLAPPPTSVRPANAAPASAPTTSVSSVPKVVVTPASESQPPSVRQSPPKPILTLAIPKGSEQATRVPASVRDSVVTEFAEDGEGDLAPGTIIWRPPASDPQSASTTYYADRAGNWILSNPSTRQAQASIPTKTVIQEAPSAPVEVELPSPDHKTRAERARDVYGGFVPDAVVSPLRLPRKPGQPRLGSPIAFKDQRRTPQLSSPNLSERLSQTAESPGGAPNQVKNRLPDPYFAAVRDSRDLTGVRSKRRSARRASRRISLESATSIESAAAGPFEDEDLSPVTESLHTPISPGKSPVKYPKIPRSNEGQQAPGSDLLPPENQYNVWRPPGHSSTAGAGSLPKTKTATPSAAPQSSAGPTRPWNAPNMQPAPNRNPGRARTGSPEARFKLAPAIEAQYWERQRQVANPASYWNQAPQTNPSARRAQPPTARARAQQPLPPLPPPTPPYELPAESPPRQRRFATATPPQQRQQQPPQQQQQQQRPTGPRRPADLPTPQATPDNHSPASRKQPQAQSQSQSQSSLLAKRRGADKAAALSLGNGNGIGIGAGRKGRGWKKEEEPPQPPQQQTQEQQKQPPQQYQQQYQQQQQQQQQQEKQQQYQQYGPVPITPGWVPELTPTRRGEDLVLNVQ